MQSELHFLQAVELLQAGVPVAFPTETVYGLGAPVFDPGAVAKVFLLKGRPADNPVIAHVSCFEDVERLASDLPAAFFLLAHRFWPGPLTMVLKRRSEVPAIVSAGHSTIAVRMPSHPIALKLIEAVGQPLIAPSANLSGRPSPTSAAHVKEDFGEDVLVLDGGECPIGIESTVISLVSPRPILLRPGSIDQKELEDVLGMPVALASPQDAVHSPGMKHRHYSPRAKISLAFNLGEIKDAAYLLSSVPLSSARLFTQKNFYARLREADQLGVAEITIYCDPAIQQDAGIMNRIGRAAGL